MKIEKGVPLPERTQRKKPKKYRKYPWKEMMCGDSIVVSSKHALSAREAGRRWFKRNRPHLTVASRKVTPQQIRIWIIPTEEADDQAV